MNKRKNFTIFANLLLLIVLCFSTLIAQQKSTEKIWIYFKDKNTNVQETLSKQSKLISERAIKRRQKVLKTGDLISERDIPVTESYINIIKPFVKKIRTKSKWLNAVSVEADPAQISEIKALYFVDKVTPVLTYKRDIPKNESQENSKKHHLNKTAVDINYGNSATQLELMNVPALHAMGYYGQGVLICMLDDGFNLLNLHETFDSLNVVATHDFINNDSSVDDTGTKATEGWHGTKTLSCIAGYTPGGLIGPAFKASFLLAKTEVDSSETSIEEDYWVAGIEWAEANGADIVSSSLGYIDWYTPEDMNGHTAVTTIAADIAVNLGMIVVNSAGNEGLSDEHNTLIAPADGYHVIAVGAVTNTGERSSFSSVGPSADGRIKPDVAAMGSGVYVASSYDTAGYTFSNGTSFSCPLTSGAIALLLNAYPQLTPAQVYTAITKTASQSVSPDNLLGYGIINIEAAYYSIDTSNLSPDTPQPEIFELEQNYPNPFNSETTISYSLYKSAIVEINIYDLQGRKLASFPQGYLHARVEPYRFSYNFKSYASGVYIYRVKAKESTGSNILQKSKKMIFIK